MLLAAVSFVSASEDVNQTDDVNTDLNDALSISNDDNAVEAKDGGTFTDLQKKIDDASAGSTVTLENDYKYDDSFSIRGVTINKALTIEGNGHTINGMSQSHIMYVNASNVVLNNINFINGNAFEVDDDSQSEYVSYYDEDEEEWVYIENPNYYYYEMGAAIQWYGANGKLTNCYFNNNTGTWDGGALYWQGNGGAIDNCVFEKNSAEYGGAIKCEDGMNLILTNSKFVENYASWSGGAFSWYGNHTGLIRNCTFDSNYGIMAGAGAIYADNFTIVDCTFTNNYAEMPSSDDSMSSAKGDVLSSQAGEDILKGGSPIGGALWWYGENGLADNVKFINNYAYEGGAVYADICLETPRKTKFKNCLFEDNHADYRGGAMFVWGNATVEDSRFINNDAESYGGAIFWQSINGTITKNSFTGNNAEYGGAIATCTDADNFNVNYCDFNKNNATYGGAVCMRAYDSVIDHCSFKSNTASYGGAVNTREDGAVINNSNFENNKAKYGGAVYSYSSEISIYYSNFTENSANIDGGALYLEGTSFYLNYAIDALVKHSNFISNHANQYAGAIFSERDLFVGCTNFESNTADVGGAIYTYDGTSDSVIIHHYTANGSYSYSETVYYEPRFYLTISGNTTFKHNNAVYGGAIDIGVDADAYQRDLIGVLDIYEGAVFYNNTAKCGGALHLVYTHVYVDKAVFEENSAEIGGAMEIVDYSLTEIYNSKFINNDADEMGGTILAQYNVYLEGNDFTTDKAQEVVYYTNMSDIPEGELLLYNNKIQTNADYGIDFDSAAKLTSPTKLIFATQTVLKGNRINIVKLVDDKGNIIKVPSVKVKISKDSKVKFYDEVYWDDEAGGYNFNCDLEQGTYKVTGYVTCVGEMDCTSVDGVLTVVDLVLTAPDVTTYYGSGDNFTVTLSDTSGKLIANENIKITINGKSSFATTNSMGQASVKITEGVGTYDVESSYDVISQPSKITVLSTLTTNNVTANYLSAVCSAALLDTTGRPLANREVTFNINGKVFTATTDSNGVANAVVDLGVGSYIFTVTNPVNNEQKQGNLIINKINSALTLNFTQDSDTAVLTAALTPKTATGNVAFKVAGATYNQPIVDGRAVLTLSDLNGGTYDASASYNGDNNLFESSSNPVSFTVKNYVNLTSRDVTKTYGEDKSIEVLLTNAKGLPLAGQTLNVVLNGVASTVNTNANGQAVIPVDLLPNTYNAVITFNGNAKYEPATVNVAVTVNKIISKLSANEVSYTYGDSGNLAVSLKDSSGNVIVNELVTVVLAGVPSTVATDANGQISMPVSNLLPGNFTAEISYGGSAKYTASNSNAGIEVKKASPVITAKNAKFKAKTKTKKYKVTLTANGKALANTKVTLKVNKKTYTAVTNAKGKATFKIKKLTKKGNLKATIKYAGDYIYNPAKAKVKITVKK